MRLLQSYDTGGRGKPQSVHKSVRCDAGGFTLIEITVVISLIALLIVSSLPQLSGFLAANNRNKAVRWMIAQRAALKTKAVKDQIRYVLRVDISGNRIMAMPMSGEPGSEGAIPPVTDAALAAVKAQKTFVCGGDLDIVDVEFPEVETDASRTADIVFYEKGYCDQAVIHMNDGGDRFSIYIEPFLPRVTVYAGHVKFGQTWGELL